MRGSLESRLDPLGGLEKPTKALLGSSWETLGRLLGTSRGALGSPREPFRSVLVASWESFLASWARIWIPRSVITPLRAALGSKNGPKTVPKSAKTDFEKVSNLVLILETIFWDTWSIFWSDVWPGSLAICIAPLVHWCGTIFLSKHADCRFYSILRYETHVASYSNPIKFDQI